MEEAFKTLKEKGNNDLEGIIRWMKEAKIIDGKAVTEDQVRNTFGNAIGQIELETFQEAMDKLAKDSKSTVDVFISKLCDTGTVVEDAFAKLKREGKDNVENLIQWMKDSKLIDTAKETEEKARKLLADVKDKQHVELEKFKETVHKMAEDSEERIEELTSVIQEQGPRLFGAFQAATSAFKDAMNK